MTDVFVWDETVGPADVVLRTNVAVVEPDPEVEVEAPVHSRMSFWRSRQERGVANLRWVVQITGTGRVSTAGTLGIKVTGSPRSARSNGSFVLDAQDRSAHGDITIGSHFTGRASVRARARIEHRTSAVLVRVTDPPDLWDLLDLPELA